eukprot:29642-Pelagococcus_subviridis.AAC.23
MEGFDGCQGHGRWRGRWGPRPRLGSPLSTGPSADVARARYKCEAGQWRSGRRHGSVRRVRSSHRTLVTKIHRYSHSQMRHRRKQNAVRCGIFESLIHCFSTRTEGCW